MCVFVSRPMKITTFLQKNGETPKRVVDFLLERDTFRNKIMEIVDDFDEKSYNNGKPWKSSRILRVNPKFFIFLNNFSPFFRFFHFFIFHFSIFSFFHFLIFLNFLSCSFFFFFFLSGAQILNFFLGASISSRFLFTFVKKNNFS